MEFIARQINDEEVFESWLINGVADGDIKYECLDLAEVDEYYLNDNTFKDLMNCFLRRMYGAYNSGGLYCDEIVTNEGNNTLARERLLQKLVGKRFVSIPWLKETIEKLVHDDVKILEETPDEIPENCDDYLDLSFGDDEDYCIYYMTDNANRFYITEIE